MSIENKMLKRITFVIKFVIICVGIQIISQTNLQTKEIANLINQLEADIRIELKNAGPIFIEPEITDSN